MAELKVTAAMRRAKALLHKACPEKVLRQLSVNDTELPRYVAPVSMVLLRRWIADSSEFWPWLLTSVDNDSDSLRVKELAYAHLVEVLELSIKMDDGSIDYDVMKAKQRAVDLVLAKDKPMVTVANTNNTLHANQSTLPPGGVPKGLRGKSAGMIEGKILSLAEASGSREIIDVPDEEDL